MIYCPLCDMSPLYPCLPCLPITLSPCLPVSLSPCLPVQIYKIYFLFLWSLSMCCIPWDPNCGLNPLRINLESLDKFYSKSLRIILFFSLNIDIGTKNQKIKSAESGPCDQIWCPRGRKYSLDIYFVTFIKCWQIMDKSKSSDSCLIYQKKYVGYIPILNIKRAIYCNSVSLCLWWKHFRLLSNIQ